MDQTEFKKVFKANILDIMYQKGITQKDISLISGISEVMLSRYINGDMIPSFYKIYKIADALECSIDDLIHNWY